MFSWVFMLSACALLAIGRVYDERIVIANINLVVLVSIIYLVSVAFILFSVKKTILLFILFIDVINRSYFMGVVRYY